MLFAALDVDGSGDLTLAELVRFVEDTPAPGGAAVGSAPAAAEAVFKAPRPRSATVGRRRRSTSAVLQHDPMRRDNTDFSGRAPDRFWVCKHSISSTALRAQLFSTMRNDETPFHDAEMYVGETLPPLLLLLLLQGCAPAAPATTALPRMCYHYSYTTTTTTNQLTPLSRYSTGTLGDSGAQFMRSGERISSKLVHTAAPPALRARALRARISRARALPKAADIQAEAMKLQAQPEPLFGATGRIRNDKPPNVLPFETVRAKAMQRACNSGASVGSTAGRLWVS